MSIDYERGVVAGKRDTGRASQSVDSSGMQ
jgi:hypothetical protein